MDSAKKNRLVTFLSRQSDPPLVPIGQFFDGNDDIGSIGCNLSDHPGITVFREILNLVADRPDVQGVYAQVAEIDPGDDCWPFTDTVYVIGTIRNEELKELLRELEPDEVGPVDDFDVPAAIKTRYDATIYAAWWD